MKLKGNTRNFLFKFGLIARVNLNFRKYIVARQCNANTLLLRIALDPLPGESCKALIKFLDYLDSQIMRTEPVVSQIRFMVLFQKVQRSN